MKRRTMLIPLAGFLCLLALNACDPREGDNTPDANLPPQTHLSMGYFRTDSSSIDTLSLSNAVVELSWWGEDADGTIDHYEYRWNYDVDSLGQDLWTETTFESDSFIVLLTTQQDTFRFEVRAFDDKGAVDPSPAAVSLPVYNTMPNVAWVANSQELLSSFFEGDTSWTFPYVTFHFNVWDLDGLETVTDVLWALDDTTEWNTADPSLGMISFTPENLAPGPHRMFLKAQDIAEAWSETLQYPRIEDTLATGEPQTWMVRDLYGDILVILDELTEATDNIEAFRSAFSAMGKVENQDYTFWEGYKWIPYDETDFFTILNQFHMVVWSAWKNDNTELACPVLDRYLAQEGKLLISTSDIGRVSSSEGHYYPYLFDTVCLPLMDVTGDRKYIGSSDDILSDYAEFPTLHMTTRVSCRGLADGDLWFGVVPDTVGVVGADTVAVVPLYYVPAGSGSDLPMATLGARQAAADGIAGHASEVYVEFPLFYVENLDELLQYLLANDFNW